MHRRAVSPCRNVRLKLTIAYDGAPYAGWQSQTSGNTVQDILEAALETVSKTRIPIHGAGRTDAGVHALGQVAHFDTPPDSKMKPVDWQRALNANLPPTIRIVRASRAPGSSFHARFSARRKIYRYRIWLGLILPPHEHLRAWHVPHPLDGKRLRQALAIFKGRHDFRGFSANRGKPTPDTTREIHSIMTSTRGPCLSITYDGEGFLYKMVRMLTGAAVRVATGRASVEDLRALLDHPDCGKWSFVAPPDGLYLVRVGY